MNRIEFINTIRELRSKIGVMENQDLESFLEAMGRYVNDIDGYYKNTNQEIDLDKVNWQIFADILKGASIYE